MQFACQKWPAVRKTLLIRHSYERISMSSQKYERLSIVTMQDNTSAALASGARVLGATTSPYANDTNLNFWGDLELAVTFGTAPTANKLLQVYAVSTIDGSNYVDGDASVTPDVGLRLGAVA